MSYGKDEVYEDNASYSGHYCGVIARDPSVLLKVDGFTLQGVAEIGFDVEYYYVDSFGDQELELDLNSVTFHNEAGDEIASVDRLTDEQLIELGFPYKQELEKAQAEAE